MTVSPDGEGKYSIIFRNVLFRPLARGRGQLMGRRASVNLPNEAIKALSLENKGDKIAFVIGKNSSNIILTNVLDSYKINEKWQDDPQVVLEKFLSEVVKLKSEKSEILAKLDAGDIDGPTFTMKRREIIEKLNDISQKIKQTYHTMFRGASDATEFLDKKIEEFYDEYSKSFLSSTEGIVSEIQLVRQTINALDSAYRKKLFNDDDYHIEKQELESRLRSLTEVSRKAVEKLSSCI